MDKIKEKIKKLLRLSRSSNEHEAALALQRALELCSKHMIDMEDLDLDDDMRKLMSKHHYVGQRFSRIRRSAAYLVKSFFNVSYFFDRPAIVFVGTAHDIQIAEYVFEFLTKSCSECFSGYRKQLRVRKISRTRRENFIVGFFYGVSSRLANTVEILAGEGDSLSIVLRAEEERRKAYMDDTFSLVKMRKLKHRRLETTALMTGVTAGKEVNIRTPVGSSANRRTLKA